MSDEAKETVKAKPKKASSAGQQAKVSLSDALLKAAGYGAAPTFTQGSYLPKGPFTIEIGPMEWKTLRKKKPVFSLAEMKAMADSVAQAEEEAARDGEQAARDRTFLGLTTST